ncbi:MAG: DUF177 domain-containing protein [Endomicrobiia bacterium]|jgi:uncharacterized metal-binding protein YceD (DUF177 family)|nr:DUF177 domain-containing protein [Endomicrobiaceae bacterium]MDD3053303.1 DUF177 domain-containing protein [Endomicrobiaceae bacterium]MDD3922851.1 DUF177 domain-containing protein [Endomicrobiaceae bacterium]MDD5101866.1 DUF177 domain-containing protein [Endomicrobiaceae bacterium]
MEKFILSFDDFKKRRTLSVKDEAFNFDIDNDVVKSSDIKFSFKADKYDDIINVVGNITGIVSFECSRCLCIFSQNINLCFDCSFSMEEHEIDLAKEIKENIILNIPMSPLCKQDCQGICQFCGNNKNEKNCSCEKEVVDEFVAEKWPKIKILNITGGKNAKSKKKT